MAPGRFLRAAMICEARKSAGTDLGCSTRRPLEIAQASSSFFCPSSDSAFFRRASNGSLGAVFDAVDLVGFASCGAGLADVVERGVPLGVGLDKR